MKILWLMLGLLVLLSTGCSRDEAVRDASELRDPLLRQAHARLREGDRDGALDSMDRALLRKPELAQAHLDAALLYDEYRKDYVRAIYHYRRYLELRPDAEKRGMIEDLIHKSQMALVATLTEQGGARDQRIRQLQEENARLLNDLREMRANLARQRLAAAGASPAAPSATAPAAAPSRPQPDVVPTPPAADGGASSAVAPDSAEF
ncbi:MAG: hypothetical protein LC725_09930, partial [Lentisphaerae bacterium]|nr:hypothetical protein [Lentisphaerota bacterium]